MSSPVVTSNHAYLDSYSDREGYYYRIGNEGELGEPANTGIGNRVARWGQRIVSEENPSFAKWAKELSAYQEQAAGRPKAVSKVRIAEAPYKVSRMVQEENAGIVRRQVSEHQYLGDTNSKAFQRTIDNLPSELNASLFLKNLPEDIDVAEIFNIITTGAVLSVHIRPAVLPKHPLSAASINFMKSAGAARFMYRVRSDAGVLIRGNKIRGEDLVYNYHGMITFPEHAKKSRVLKITGPAKWMNWEFWKVYFDTCAKYQLSHRLFRPAKDESQMEFEVGFARFDAQAESIYHAIRKE